MTKKLPYRTSDKKLTKIYIFAAVIKQKKLCPFVAGIESKEIIVR